MPETTEHRVSASITIGGLHPDAVHISDNGYLGVGIHIKDAGIYVSLFGTLHDLAAIVRKLDHEFAVMAVSRANATIRDEQLGATS